MSQEAITNLGQLGTCGAKQFAKFWKDSAGVSHPLADPAGLVQVAMGISKQREGVQRWLRDALEKRRSFFFK